MRRPFRFDKDGTGLPLFVPAAMLDTARATWPQYQVEAEPGPRPHGRPWGAADMAAA